MLSLSGRLECGLDEQLYEKDVFKELKKKNKMLITDGQAEKIYKALGESFDDPKDALYHLILGISSYSIDRIAVRKIVKDQLIDMGYNANQLIDEWETTLRPEDRF